MTSLLATLRDRAGADLITGRYTRTTLMHLVRNLSMLSFRDGQGVLLVSVENMPEADWPIPELDPAIQIEHLPADAIGNEQPIGVLLCGLGPGGSFVVNGTTEHPGEISAADPFVVSWSCDPVSVNITLDWLEATLEATDPRYVAALRRARHDMPPRPPSPQTLLGLSARLLNDTTHLHEDLAATNQTLVNKLRWREDQARMVVHDMRAPLHTLTIGLKTLLRHQLDIESQHELLEISQESANHLLSLSETLLQISRLEAGVWQLKLQPIAVPVLVQAVCRPFELAPRPNQAPIRTAIAADLPPVSADQRLLERVLTNLLTNAIKYTPADGEILITARLTAEGKAIEVAVSDTGQGIPAETLPHIFDRFYQARGGDRSHGIGFGLYFCQLAMEAHGGTISATSQPNTGSTFTITLPLEPPAQL